MQSKYVHVSRKKKMMTKKLRLLHLESWPSVHFYQKYFLEEALDRYTYFHFYGAQTLQENTCQKSNTI